VGAELLVSLISAGAVVASALVAAFFRLVQNPDDGYQ
jgi:hypothetical protein